MDYLMWTINLIESQPPFVLVCAGIGGGLITWVLRG